MLSKQNISQLRQLKQDINESKVRLKGRVKGTQQRHGFVQLDSGKQLLLPHMEMERVFPGDSINITKEKDEKGKEFAKIDSLIESKLTTFTGQIVTKGNNSFVIPDVPMMSRWLFIPPAKRAGSQEGDFVSCAISRHPFKNGKPQAIVNEVIAKHDAIGVEQDYTIYKFNLSSAFPDHVIEGLEQHCLTTLEEQAATRKGLCDLAFLTIDNPKSQDLDDALFVEKTESGWRLQVAIADPCAFIKTNSELDQIARKNAVTTYFPDRVLGMLPDILANNYCSLLPGQKRLALVCKIEIGTEGQLLSHEFTEALIESKGKFDYSKVAQIIDNTVQLPDGDDAVDASLCDVINELWALRNALHTQRQSSALVMSERPDYELTLGESKKIDRIIKHERNNAHRLVEECMLIVNRCAADFLIKHNITAPFISHPGFREEKKGFVEKVLKQLYPDYSPGPLNELESYIALIKHVKANPVEEPAIAVLSRQLKPSKLTNKALPHMGMGLPAYTSCSSPLRKYNDLLVHRAIKCTMTEGTAENVSDSSMDRLHARMQESRQAVSQWEHWLKCQYLTQMVGTSQAGTIVKITSAAITVRLDALDVVGTIDKNKLEGKFKFDPLLMKLASKSLSLRLEDAVTVKVLSADPARKQNVFALVSLATDKPGV